MGKTKVVTINNFSGGMSNDKRSNNPSKFAFASHFDIFTYPHKLVPRVRTEDKESGATDIVKFLYADRGGTQTLWGFDKTVGGFCSVRYWNGSAWVQTANPVSASDARNEDVFFHYKSNIYMWGAGELKQYATDGSGFDDTYQTIAWSTVAQPVHHPTDDIAYFFADNDVHTLNGAAWTSDALVLPTSLNIVSATAHGNYLAIACNTDANISQGGKSTVFLWDRDSSLTTISDRIDFDGIIKHIASLDNRLIVVLEVERERKIVVKEIIGSYGRTINELTIDDGAVFPATSQIVDGRLYFPMEAPLDSVSREGIWAIDSLGRMSLDFVHATATSYQGILWTGDIWWLAHTNDGSISRSVAGNAVSLYESLIIGTPSRKQKLISVGVMTEPLAAKLAGTGSGIDIKYKTNKDTSWQTIASDIGERFETFHEAVNIQSSGANLPQFNEIEFQITFNTDNDAFTGLRVKYEDLNEELSS